MPRLSVILAMAALLGGCGNLVYSERPLFSKHDRIGVPSFRPGLWAAAEPGCALDPATPLEAWPACANGTRMGRRGPIEDRDAEAKELLIAAGDPLIAQSGGRGESRFAYLAVAPTAFDGRRRITAFKAWPVQCGPPPPQGETEAGSARRLTRELLPGLEAAGDDCIARDRETVRRAARASAAWAPPGPEIRWMRDGSR